MKKTELEIDGGRYGISCVLFEPTEGEISQVIIALHGFGGDKDSSAVYQLAVGLTERGRAVVCFDFPSHGRSPVGDKFFTVDNCRADAAAVYEYVKGRYFKDGGEGGKIHFFATSFGAFILCQLLRDPSYGKARAVLRSPAVKMEETFLCPIANLSAEELASGRIAECGFGRKLYLGYDFWLDLKEHSIDGVSFENKALMIYGDRDDVVSPSHMAGFAADRGNIEAVVIEGADHRFKGRGQLDAVISAALDFLC